MSKTLPNFLIVGVAKSGTTSLVNYIGQNPQVFISKKKEPRYLTFELLENSGYNGPGDFRPKSIAVKTFKEYQNLFSKVPKEVKAVGESSVDTIYYYKHTIPKIRKEIGDPKIIILLRDPVKRAISAYSHLVREERESLDFKEAINQEEYRMKKGYESIWSYYRGGCYYDPVKMFKEEFSQVKIVIFEDLINDQKKEVADILTFLEIKTHHQFINRQFNKSGKPKNKMINKFLVRKSWIKSLLKILFGKALSLRVKEKIQLHNLENIEIDNNIKKELFIRFERDIERLEEYLSLDLSAWKKYK